MMSAWEEGWIKVRKVMKEDRGNTFFVEDNLHHSSLETRRILPWIQEYLGTPVPPLPQSLLKDSQFQIPIAVVLKMLLA